MLLRIVADHFVAGIEVGCYAAPIIGYMLPWDETRIRSYCKSKGWRVAECKGVGALRLRCRTVGDTLREQRQAKLRPSQGQ